MPTCGLTAQTTTSKDKSPPGRMKNHQHLTFLGGISAIKRGNHGAQLTATNKILSEVFSKEKENSSGHCKSYIFPLHRE